MAAFDTCFNVHGQPVRVVTKDGAIATAAQEILAPFSPMAVAGAKPLEVELHAVATREDVPLKPGADSDCMEPPRKTPGEYYTLYREAKSWLVDFHTGGMLRIDLEAERIEGWIVSPETQSTDWAGSFVLFSTLELLRLRRVYAVHAAGLVKNGIGVIIAAPGGSGKTTSCLSLIRGGYRCLSDDHPLLRETKDGGVEMLAFRGRVAVTRKTVEWFPELQAAQAGFRQETVKRSFFLEQVWPDAAGAACQPRILIFPRVVDWPESSLEPMPRSRALEELLPQTLLVLDRELAARQFRTFAKLIQTVDCYRLHFGEDILGLPALFDQLIAAKTGSKAVSQREATP